MTESRTMPVDRWNDDDDAQAPSAWKALSQEEAQALRRAQPPVSVWRVVSVQAVVGLGAALVSWLVAGDRAAAWSALYGAAVVVVPGALMAWGTTRQSFGMNPGVRVVRFMLWEFLKIGGSVAMLMLAPRLVPMLSWPALLVALVVCIKVYWFALLWRGR